jgi:hypothetical protein
VCVALALTFACGRRHMDEGTRGCQLLGGSILHHPPQLPRPERRQKCGVSVCLGRLLRSPLGFVSGRCLCTAPKASTLLLTCLALRCARGTTRARPTRKTFSFRCVMRSDTQMLVLVAQRRSDPSSSLSVCQKDFVFRLQSKDNTLLHILCRHFHHFCAPTDCIHLSSSPPPPPGPSHSHPYPSLRSRTYPNPKPRAAHTIRP